jgi:beta-galactosidase
VEALDAKGRIQPNADQMVQFEINGPGVIAAVGNEDGTSDAPYQGSRRRLFHGRALLVIRMSTTPGTVRIKATAPGLTAAEQSIRAQETTPRLEL